MASYQSEDLARLTKCISSVIGGDDDERPRSVEVVVETMVVPC